MLLGTAREGSTRLKQKMIRPFAGTTLFDIYLHLLETLQESGLFQEAGVAVWPGDKVLMRIAGDYSVPIIERSEASATGLHKRSDELHVLKNFDSDYVVWINGCLPLLKATTVIEAVEYFKTHEDVLSMTPVMPEYNWFWLDDASPINNKDPHCVSTQGCPPVYKSLHAFHIFNRYNMIANSQYWEYTKFGYDPMLWKIEDTTERHIEFMDIDSEFDFMLCETQYSKSITDK